MNSHFVRVFAFIFGLALLAPSVSATRIYERPTRTPVRSYITTPTYQYQWTTTSTLMCSSYTSASVWVGTLINGVMVTIDSSDSVLQNCIKNTTWLTYFTRFGNTVNVSISHTTHGVQITATSYDAGTVSNLQNATWRNIITGTTTQSERYGYTYNPPPTYYNNNQYPRAPERYHTERNTTSYNQWYYSNGQYYTTQPTYSSNQGYYSNGNYYTTQPSNSTNQIYSYNGQYYTTHPSNTYYTTPARTYRAGSSIFPNTNQMYRALTYVSNGVKVTLTSADYSTMRYLQGYSYASLFSDLSGVSLSTSNIAGGVEVTITAGNTSTVEQLQKAGYALVYQ